MFVALCAATACGRLGYEMIDENNQPIGTSSGPGGAGGAWPPVTTGSAGLGGATSSATTAAGSTGVGTGSGGVGGATAGSTGVGAGGSATGGGAAGSTTGGGGAGGSATGAGGSATGAGGSVTGSGGGGTTGAGGASVGSSGAAGGGTAGASGAVGSGAGTSSTGGAAGSGGAGGAGGSLSAGGSSGSSGAAGSADAGGSTCLSGMSAAFNAHNYFFCSTQVTWDVARTDCHARGMFLVRIDDQAENDWVHSMIPAADQANNNTSLWRWMGGNMLVTVDDWKWDDGESFWSGGKNGTPVNGLYANWPQTEPVGTNNLCLSMSARFGTWYNMDCTGGRPYVCEQY
jgi:hypothetical protein